MLYKILSYFFINHIIGRITTVMLAKTSSILTLNFERDIIHDCLLWI